jgi:hypothetical protein
VEHDGMNEQVIITQGGRGHFSWMGRRVAVAHLWRLERL